MALVVSKIKELSGDGVRRQFYDLTFTAVTTDTFKTGLNTVIFAVHNNETTEGDGLMKKNKSATSTTAQGDLYFEGFTSGDVVSVEVVGV